MTSCDTFPRRCLVTTGIRRPLARTSAHDKHSSCTYNFPPRKFTDCGERNSHVVTERKHSMSPIIIAARTAKPLYLEFSVESCGSPITWYSDLVKNVWQASRGIPTFNLNTLFNEKGDREVLVVCTILYTRLVERPCRLPAE